MISLERLMSRFETMAAITAPGLPGINRLAFTDSDWQGREYLMSLMRDARLSLHVDSFGNVIGRRAGKDDSLPAVMFGSHGDSVPSGGNFDGVVGILSAIEVMQSLDEDGITTKAPLECVLFMCEESSRFGAATLGSRAMCGELTEEDTLRYADKNGVTLHDVLMSRGLSPASLASANYLSYHDALPRAFLEVHIEQGKVLDTSHEKIGVVTGIAAPTRMRVHIHGSADHSGATPMELRRDGMCAAAEAILAVEQSANEASGIATKKSDDENNKAAAPASRPPVVGTVGVVEAAPNAMNVIPGEVTLGIDIRSIDYDAKRAVVDKIKSRIDDIMTRRGISYDIEPISDEKPIAISKEMVDFLSSICEEHGVAYRAMMSGAGHDAMHWAERVPTGMLFIPCRDGISHNPAESAKPEDIVTAARLLEDAVKKLGNT